MTLRDRCLEFLALLQRNAIMRQGSPPDDLEAFVLAENGRAADPSLADTKPLVLYFPNAADREEFIASVLRLKPSMVSRKMP